MIGLFNEQKLYIIDHAVTRGLDTSAKLKPSGVEWMGDIPEHWNITKLTACIKIARTGVWGVDPTEKNKDDHLICVRVADFDTDTSSVSAAKLTIRAVVQNERTGRLLEDGDILLEKSGGGEKTPVGRVVSFTLNQQSVCSNFVARLAANRQLVRPDFLLVLMDHLHKTRVVFPFIKQTTGIQNLDSKAYFKTGIALPSLTEQETICRWIETECQPLNETIRRAEDEIKLIREYRDRLIADVVTGQVDVRGWVPGPDDVVADDELVALADEEESDTEEEMTDGAY